MTPFPKLVAPANRALAGARLKCLEDLAKITEKELADLHGMGPNALGKLKVAMKEKGLAFQAK